MNSIVLIEEGGKVPVEQTQVHLGSMVTWEAKKRYLPDIAGVGMAQRPSPRVGRWMEPVSSPEG